MRFLCSAELVGSQLAYAVSWPNVSREAWLLGCPTKLGSMVSKWVITYL